MPANKKHLTTSKSQRFAKITAGFLGGYAVTVSLFMAIAFWVDHINVLSSLRFGGFMLWATLFVVAFLFRNGWKVWGIYLLCTLVFSGLIYIGKIYNPIV
ncbi:hypothetical protein DN752_23225 [Echinicola strongylocentroti]|uniref:Uncharacterized protein n=1 Tax=Echinicola strongylocentroti TaxID=1795355 RepID=A0A2Z4IQB5_9BACT|nr:hypothetical protein [Echinicola strongylocentroti]AWW32818.1 hypothetical protein DN752_23225 [Echinicola strongylocentroti]